MNNWINVKDRMPEEYRFSANNASKIVNVYVRCNNSDVCFVSCDMTYDGKWVDFSEPYHTVTHWMPLPEPPKVEK